MSTGDAMLDGGRNLGAVGRTVANSYDGKNYGDAVVSGLPGPITSGIKVVKGLQGDTHPAQLALDATNFISSCSGTAAAIASNPLNWLIGQGLGFLMNVCTPLKQAIDLVSGNPDALKEAATRFGEVGQDVLALNQDMITALETELAGWQGQAADAARERLGRFAGGVDGVAGKAGDIAQMLQICSMVMQVVEEFIKGLLTDLIEWLIVTWVAALAAAPATFGGSTAAASGATAVQATQKTAQGAQKVSKLTQLLNKIKEFIARIQAFLKGAPATFMEKTGRQAFAEAQQAVARGEVRDMVLDKLAESAKKRALGAVGLGYDGETGRPKIPTTKVGDRDLPDVGKVIGKVKGYYDGGKTAADYGSTGSDRSDRSISGDLDL